MKNKYKSVIYQLHSREGSSHHNTADLDEVLNKQAQDGWELVTLAECSVGFILIFRMET